MVKAMDCRIVESEFVHHYVDFRANNLGKRMNPLILPGIGARGVIVIVVGKWTRRLEFKSWTRLIAFHIALIPSSYG